MGLQGSGPTGKVASRKKVRNAFVAAVYDIKNHFVRKCLASKCNKYCILPAWLWKSLGSDRSGH